MSFGERPALVSVSLGPNCWGCAERCTAQKITMKPNIPTMNNARGAEFLLCTAGILRCGFLAQCTFVVNALSLISLNKNNCRSGICCVAKFDSATAARVAIGDDSRPVGTNDSNHNADTVIGAGDGLHALRHDSANGSIGGNRWLSRFRTPGRI